MKSKIVFTKRFYFLLLFVSILFFLFSSLHIWPIEIEASDYFGLISHLPLTYWVGIAILLLCIIGLMIHPRRHNISVYIPTLFVLCVYLFGTTIFMMENPIIPSAYYPSSEVNLILQVGHIDHTESYPPFAYHTWPGIHFLSASLITINRIKIQEIIMYAPLIWAFIGALLIFGLAERIGIKQHHTFIVSLLFLLSTWGFRVGYMPIALAFLLYLSAFVYLLHSRPGSAEFIVFLISFGTITMTHALTGLILLLGIILVSLYKRRWSLITLSVTFYVGWLFFYASASFEAGITNIISMPFQDIISLSSSIQDNSPSVAIIVSRYSQFAYVTIYSGAIVSSMILIERKRISLFYKDTLIVCFLLAIGATMVIVIPYGELFHRIFWFAAVPASCIIVICLNRPIVLIPLFIVLFSLHILIHFSSHTIQEEISTSEIKGTRFFAESVKPFAPYTFLLAGDPALIWSFDPVLVQNYGTSYMFTSDQAMWHDSSSIQKFSYVIVSKQGTRIIQLHGQNNLFEKWLTSQESQKSFLIYSNGSFDIYHNRNMVN